MSEESWREILESDPTAPVRIETAVTREIETLGQPSDLHGRLFLFVGPEWLRSGRLDLSSEELRQTVHEAIQIPGFGSGSPNGRLDPWGDRVYEIVSNPLRASETSFSVCSGGLVEYRELIDYDAFEPKGAIFIDRLEVLLPRLLSLSGKILLTRTPGETLHIGLVLSGILGKRLTHSNVMRRSALFEDPPRTYRGDDPLVLRRVFGSGAIWSETDAITSSLITDTCWAFGIPLKGSWKIAERA